MTNSYQVHVARPLFEGLRKSAIFAALALLAQGCGDSGAPENSLHQPESQGANSSSEGEPEGGWLPGFDPETFQSMSPIPLSPREMEQEYYIRFSDAPGVSEMVAERMIRRFASQGEMTK